MDETGFRSFYDRTAPALRSYLRMLCKDAVLADDLLQESYLRFLRARIPDMNEFQMKAYLYKAAGSAANDHWKVEKRERNRIKEDSQNIEPTADTSLSQDIRRFFDTLRKQQQALLWLAYVEGFQHREIAEILHLKDKSVRVLLLRARKEFAKILLAKGIGPGEPL